MFFVYYRHLTEEGIELCTQVSGRSDIDGLIKAALDVSGLWTACTYM